MVYYRLLLKPARLNQCASIAAADAIPTAFTQHLQGGTLAKNSVPNFVKDIPSL
jgi:hypothetical protein